MGKLPRYLVSALCTVAFCAAIGDPPSRAARAARVEDILARMTLEEKIGQMVMAGIEGYAPGADAEWLIKEGHIGGAILFSRNVESPGQVARLVRALQEMATASGARIPLLIAADQEGGNVVRFDDATIFPGNMALGAAGDPDLAYRSARVMAEELRAMGVTVNFAPVVDVNNNPENPVIGIRSFGENPESVAALGAAMVRGFQDGGVLATAKHFPGHGDTGVDSHIGLPTVAHDRDRLDRVELFPFRAAIEAGVGAIMTAHVTFPAIDPTPGMPATLSRPVLTGLLREEMGFEGLIFTDAMEMGAISKNFGSAEAAVKAVLAGADVVLIGWPRDWRLAVDTVRALLEAARSGVLSAEWIDASVKRILQAKERLGLLDDAGVTVRGVEERVGAEAGRRLARTIARSSITLVKNDGSLPLSPTGTEILVVTPEVRALTAAEDTPAVTTSLGHALRRYSRSVTEVTVSLKPEDDDLRRVLKRADEADVVVVGTHRAWASGSQADLVNALIKTGKPVVALALREPYDFSRFPDVAAYVATYGYVPIIIETLGEVLFGETEPKGKLPVRIPGHYEVGHGLSY